MPSPGLLSLAACSRSQLAVHADFMRILESEDSH